MLGGLPYRRHIVLFLPVETIFLLDTSKYVYILKILSCHNLDTEFYVEILESLKLIYFYMYEIFYTCRL